MTLPLYAYQKRAVNHYARFNGRVLNADVMGLGKSPPTVVYCKWNDEWPVVVVCPASVRTHWVREFRKFADVRAVELEGTSPPTWREFSAYPRERAYVISYDVLKEWMPVLRRLGPKVVVIDECQMLQSRGTKRTRQTRRLCRGVGKVIALSGTPLTIRPAELWPTLNLLWPDEFPSFFTFAHKHCGPRKRPWGWEFKGAVRVPELNRTLKACGMIRRRKEDVLKDLPPKVRYTVQVPLADPDEYKEAEEEFLKWLAKTHGRSKARRAAAVEKLVKVGYMLRLTGRLKRPAIQAWVEKFRDRAEGKLITFGYHKHMVRGLYEKFPGSVIIDGSVTGRVRQRAVDRFTRVKSCRLLFGNMIAAGTGWNGTAANDVAMTELYWKPGVLAQAEDRPHRVGQTGEVRVWYLIARGTVEEELADLIDKRQKVVEGVLDGAPRDDMSLVNEWLDTLLEKRR